MLINLYPLYSVYNFKERYHFFFSDIRATFPASILYKSTARSQLVFFINLQLAVRVADGPITARYRLIKNAYWVPTEYALSSVDRSRM